MFAEPLGEISLEEFLAMLSFEQRNQLAELGFQDFRPPTR
jgi:hypothetical protein